MELKGKIAVITGSGNGIGEAIAERWVAEGARVVVVDVEEDRVAAVADRIGALGVVADLTAQQDVQRVVATVEEALGPIDVWHSNAGIAGPRQPGELQDIALWDTMWDLHVMAHLHAVKAVLPSMLERGSGYLLQTSSSTALSSQVDKAAYSVTKSAALAFSEWLAVTYRHRGIAVSCFCPGPMMTRMFLANGFKDDSPALRGAVTPEQVAEIVVQGMRDERFLILTQPDKAQALADKATDYDVWIDATRTSYQELVGKL